jgi:hypothetical protein
LVQKWCDISKWYWVFRKSILEQIGWKCGINQGTCSWKYTIHDLANEVGISIGSYQSILTQGLNMQQIATKFVPCLLTDEERQNHPSVCQEELQRDSTVSFVTFLFSWTSSSHRRRWYLMTSSQFKNSHMLHL